HKIGHLWLQDISRLVLGCRHVESVGRFHAMNRVRLNASALVCERRVGSRQFNRLYFKSAEGYGGISLDSLVQAHAMCERSDAPVADALCNLPRGGVQRLL